MSSVELAKSEKSIIFAHFKQERESPFSIVSDNDLENLAKNLGWLSGGCSGFFTYKPPIRKRVRLAVVSVIDEMQRKVVRGLCKESASIVVSKAELVRDDLPERDRAVLKISARVIGGKLQIINSKDHVDSRGIDILKRDNSMALYSQIQTFAKFLKVDKEELFLYLNRKRLLWNHGRLPKEFNYKTYDQDTEHYSKIQRALEHLKSTLIVLAGALKDLESHPIKFYWRGVSSVRFVEETLNNFEEKIVDLEKPPNHQESLGRPPPLVFLSPLRDRITALRDLIEEKCKPVRGMKVWRSRPKFEESMKSIGIEKKSRRFLGKGAYGSVYLHRRGKKLEAVKVFKDKEGRLGESGETIAQEIATIGLFHPHIIQIKGVLPGVPCTFDEGCIEEDDAYGYVMEHVNGVEVSDYNNEMSTNERLYVFFQLLDAMQFLESRGILHRDIKRENVMIDPKTKQIKIIDFGKAKSCRAGKKKVEFEADRRIAFYWAPETDTYREYSHEVNGWQLGCFLYLWLIRNNKGNRTNKIWNKFILPICEIKTSPEYALFIAQQEVEGVADGNSRILEDLRAKRKRGFELSSDLDNCRKYGTLQPALQGALLDKYACLTKEELLEKVEDSFRSNIIALLRSLRRTLQLLEVYSISKQDLDQTRKNIARFLDEIENNPQSLEKLNKNLALLVAEEAPLIAKYDELRALEDSSKDWIIAQQAEFQARMFQGSAYEGDDLSEQEKGIKACVISLLQFDPKKRCSLDECREMFPQHEKLEQVRKEMALSDFIMRAKSSLSYYMQREAADELVDSTLKTMNVLDASNKINFVGFEDALKKAIKRLNSLIMQTIKSELMKKLSKYSITEEIANCFFLFIGVIDSEGKLTAKGEEEVLFQNKISAALYNFEVIVDYKGVEGLGLEDWKENLCSTGTLTDELLFAGFSRNPTS